MAIRWMPRPKTVHLSSEERDFICAFHDFLEYMRDAEMLSPKGKQMYSSLWKKIYKEPLEKGKWKFK